MVRKLGYVDRWLVVGPFDNEGKSGLDEPFEPERAFGEPIVPGRAYTGKERPVRWRQVPQVFHRGWLDFGALMRPRQHICAYATTFLSPPPEQKPRPLSVWVGAGGAYKLFFNGQLVLSDKAYRGHDADRSVVLVQPRPGANNLTVKVCGNKVAPVVSVRLADAAGGTRADVRLSNSPAESAKANQAIAASPEEVLRTTTLEGPLQALSRRTEDTSPSPQALEDLEVGDVGGVGMPVGPSPYPLHGVRLLRDLPLELHWRGVTVRYNSGRW